MGAASPKLSPRSRRFRAFLVESQLNRIEQYTVVYTADQPGGALIAVRPEHLADHAQLAGVSRHADHAQLAGTRTARERRSVRVLRTPREPPRVDARLAGAHGRFDSGCRAGRRSPGPLSGASEASVGPKGRRRRSQRAPQEARDEERSVPRVRIRVRRPGTSPRNEKTGPADAGPVSSVGRARLADQLLRLRGFALRLVPGIVVVAVRALLTKTRALPDQIVDRALQLLDAVGEIGRTLFICHGR